MQLLKQIEEAKNNADPSDRGSDVGYLIPMYSRPQGLNTAYVGVVTEEGLFAIDIPPNDALAQDLKTQSYEQPVEVEVGIDSVYYDGQKVAKRTRYDGNAFDPTSQNTGNIEIVHKMGNSGDLVLTSIDSTRNGLEFRAHGQTLLNNILETVKDIVNSISDVGKEELSKYYQFVDVLYGENMDVDYEMLELEPRGTGMRAAKARFLTKKIETGTTMILKGYTSDEAAETLSGEDGDVDPSDIDADEDASEDTSDEDRETRAVESVEGDSPNGLKFS